MPAAHRSLTLLATLAIGLSAGCGGPQPARPATPAEAPSAPSAAGTPNRAHRVRGTAPRAANNGVVIVTLAPDAAREFAAPETPAQMDQVNLTFVPAVLLVRTGQPVTFLNNDDTLHNVRVREEATREGAFNVAIPTGEDFVFTFPRDGFYIVGCDIHPGMAAAIFASSTPYATVADADGSFEFPDVEPGSYTLSAFAGQATFTQPVVVADPVTDVTVAGNPPGPTSN